MKLLISCVFFATCALGNSVVIYHTPETQIHDAVKSRLILRHGVPDKLIKSYLVQSCPKSESYGNRLVLCANKKELEVLHSNSSIIKSLAVFKSEAR